MQARYSYSSNITKGSHLEAIESAYAVYLKGLQTYPSEELYNCCCIFLCELLEGAKGSIDSDNNLITATEDRLQSMLMDCIEKATDSCLASENLLLHWIFMSKSVSHVQVSCEKGSD